MKESRRQRWFDVWRARRAAGERADVLAFRAAGAANGGYDDRPELEGVQVRTGTPLDVLKIERPFQPVPYKTPVRCDPPGQTVVVGGIYGGAAFPSDACPCGGHIGWLDRGNRFEGTCYGECGDHTVISHDDSGAHYYVPTDAADEVERLQADYAQLERDFAELEHAHLVVLRDLHATSRKLDAALTVRDNAVARAEGGRLAP